MDSENKYKDALERARKLLKTSVAYDRFTIEKIFPELKESEDERIRKELIFYLGDMPEDTELRNGVTNRDVLAWLEKQKEIDKEIVFRPLAGTDIIVAAKQALEKIEIGKEIILAFNGAYIPVNGKTVAEICNEYFAWLEKQGKKKTTNKVEPKFKVGDWVANDYCTGKVIALTDDAYLLDSGQGIPFSCEHNVHLWTIADAKDGDVLVDVYGNIGIFQKNDDFDWSSYCSLGPNGGFRCFAIEHELDGSHPATKEQRDTLERAMTNAGYEWDAEKKVFKTIDENSKCDVVEYVYILDYCSGRVIVAKHNVEETIETLFKKLGLKESQCHYMVSDKILSIEYINF